ncbi:MAG: hypothetical protein LUD68_00125 [Rikenellaceae bacterium]|nr:hypothetical protein [Rikenellaceae bacterium]
MNAGDLDEFNPKLYDSLRLEIADRSRDLPSPEIGKNTYKDLDEVKASFLIDHIEAAFFDWKNNPFSKKLTFDEFKEFLHPYIEVEGLKDDCMGGPLIAWLDLPLPILRR